VRAIALALCVVLFSGCALLGGAFTKPTGLITIDRQEFINTYAVVKVIYKRMLEDATVRCDEAQPCLARIEDTNAQAKALAIQIEAKIEVPESQIDWATVVALLKALASLVP